MDRRKKRLRQALYGFVLVVVFAATGSEPVDTSAEKTGQKHALLISAGQSKHRTTLLAEAIKALRENGFPDENIRLLKAQDATWENVQQTIEELYEELEDNDSLVVYLSGTGTLRGEGDASERILFLWNNTAVKTSILAAQLAGLKPLSGLVALDTPYIEDFVQTLKDSSYVIVAPTKEENVAGCATFSMVFWKELQRAAKDGQRKLLNSVEGAYLVAEAHAKRRNSAQPLLMSLYDPENYFLWLPPRNQFDVDRRLALGSRLQEGEKASLGLADREAIQEAASAYDDLQTETEAESYEEEIPVEGDASK